MQYVFHDYVLDMARRELRGTAGPLSLEPKVYQVLVYLIEHRDRVVTRTELLEQVWPGVYVDDSAVARCIRTIRQVVGDSAGAQRVIQTRRGYGYRFVATVREQDTASAAEFLAEVPAPTPLRPLQNPAPPAADRMARVMAGEARYCAVCQQSIPVSARFCAACGAPAAPVCRHCGEAAPEHATFCPACGQSLVAAPLSLPEGHSSVALLPAVATSSASLPDLQGERKLVTVLCGTLALAPSLEARLDLDGLHELLIKVDWLVRQVSHPYGGTLQELTSNRVVILFGAPAAQEDHALRAVLAALALQQQWASFATDHKTAATAELSICLGLHTGFVVIEEGVCGLTHTVTVVGETPMLAARLADHAAPGTIIVSAATAALIQETVRLETLPPLPAAPQTAPVLAFRVLEGATGQETRNRRQQRSHFVGREAELTILRRRLGRVLEGQGQVVGIIGEPGMGKSRLLEEFRQSVTAQPVTYVAGMCQSYGRATPYLPLLALVRQQCGVTEEDDYASLTSRVGKCLQALDMVPDAWSAGLLYLFGVPEATARLARVTPEARKVQTFEALHQFLVRSSQHQPLVIAVENLHWIDATSEAYLTELVERLSGTRILLVVTTRPGYQPPWAALSYVTHMALQPLSPRDSLQVVQSVLTRTPLAAPIAQQIVAKAQGNPFFLEELAQMVHEQGPAMLGAAVPTTVQAVLAARLDRLSPAAKQVLQTAAVLGPDVSLPLLQALLDVPAERLEQCLRSLQSAELLYETRLLPEPVYTFKHVLTQEVAYQSLLRRTRQQVHARVAQVLVTHFPNIAAQPERLAHHYAEAGWREQAIDAWQQAGQRAVERSAYTEALAHLTQALDALKTLPATPARAQRELTALIALGPVLVATRGHAAPEVEQTYARARSLCEQVGETPRLFPTLWGLYRFYLSRGALPTARELGEQLYSLAQREAEPTPLLEAHDALGTTLFHLGEYAASRAHIEQNIALTDPTSQRLLVFRHDVLPRVRCLAVAANTLWCLGYPGQAIQRQQEALALAQTLTHPYSLAQAHYWAAFLQQRCRDAPAVQAQAEALLTLAIAQGFPLWVGFGTCWRGWALAMQGQGAASLAQMQQGLRTVLATGQTLSQPLCLVLLAEAAGCAGQVEEGLRLLDEALAAFAASGRGDLLAEAYRLQGELLLQQARPDAAHAEACFQKALAIARQQQAKSWELRVAMSLSRLWRQQGRRQEAHDLLVPLYGWFTEGFDTADLREAKALLAACS